MSKRMYVTLSEENYTFLKHVIGFENLDGWVNRLLEKEQKFVEEQEYKERNYDNENSNKTTY